jgi:hypothetical protein
MAEFVAIYAVEDECFEPLLQLAWRRVRGQGYKDVRMMLPIEHAALSKIAAGLGYDIFALIVGKGV